MLPSIKGALAELTFGRTTAAEVQIFEEVPAIHGVPDLTAVRFDRQVALNRIDAGVKPLTTDVEVRVALALGAAPIPVSQLAGRASLSSEYVRRSVVPLLCEAGWLTMLDGGFVQRRKDALWVSKRIVTVEAKLRDWSRAIGQARRQQLSADASYIALEASAVKSITGHLRQVSEAGIGVISVDADSGKSRVVVRPARVSRERTMIGRMLIAERCLAMWESGERSGQVYPVFGWTQPERLRE